MPKNSFRGKRSGAGVVEVIDYTQGLDEAYKKAMGKALVRIAKLAENHAKNFHEYNNITGNLEASTYAQTAPKEDADGLGVEVGAYMDYAAFVEAIKPFMGPSLDYAMGYADEIIKACLKEEGLDAR